MINNSASTMTGTHTCPSPLAYCVSVAGTMTTASTIAANDAVAGTSRPIAPMHSTRPTITRMT